jgi:hypothetical protein
LADECFPLEKTRPRLRFSFYRWKSLVGDNENWRILLPNAEKALMSDS